MPVAATTTLQFFWRDASVAKQFRTGVSLHSHTMYSEESLEMIPRYTSKVPYFGAALRRQKAEYSRRTSYEFAFEDAFWTPPFAPREAYLIEEEQIQRRLQLPGLVSITDHDDIRAGLLLRVLERFRAAPISTEWTLPFGGTFFHLGIHNLPAVEAGDIMQRLSGFRANARGEKLRGLLGMLNSYPDVLLVLNHPLWDEKPVGAANHAQALKNLLAEYASDIHALELNGLRSWQENRRILQVAQQSGIPLIGGGDRHGREANAILNLSRADNLADFVHEIRYRRSSHVVFMPSYREPLKLRMLQTVLDVVRDYPASFSNSRRTDGVPGPEFLSVPGCGSPPMPLEGRRGWADRVFYRKGPGSDPVPFSVVWQDGGPKLVQHFISAMRLLDSRTAESLLCMARGDRTKNSGDAHLTRPWWIRNTPSNS